MPDTTTQADVRQAEAEAAQAEQTATDLRAAFLGGDFTITSQQIEDAERDARLAALKIEAVRQLAERDAETVRQAACRQLADEMRAGQDELLAEMEAEGREIEQRLARLLTLCDAYEDRQAAWRRRMQDLRVPEYHGGMAPPAEHGRVGWDQAGNLYVGRRQISRLDAGMYLTGVLEAGRAASKQSHIHLYLRSGETPVTLNHPSPDADPHGMLAALAHERHEPTARYFYRGENGLPIATDHPYSPEDIKRKKLTVLTREEAWPE